MAEETLTTMQIDKETLRKLGVIAQAYERTKPAQVRFWVNREFADLERLKLLPDMSDSDMQTISD